MQSLQHPLLYFKETPLETPLYFVIIFINFMQGISVEGQENIQELLTKQLVLCQYTCALSILATGMYFFVNGLMEVGHTCNYIPTV